MARFLLDNKIDTAYLTGSNILTELPVNNVKYLSKSLVARSTDNSVTIISGIFSKQTTLINSFVIIGHNFNEGTKYQLRLFSNPSNDPIYEIYNSGLLLISSSEDSSTFIRTLSTLPIWIPEMEAASFEFTIIKADSNPVNYFQVYRLFCGKYIEPEVGASFNHTISWNDNSINYRTDAGSLRSDIIQPSKVISFSIDVIKESTRGSFQRILSGIGKRKEFYLDLFPCTSIEKSKDYRGLVKLTRVPAFSELAQNLYSSKYSVEEV